MQLHEAAASKDLKMQMMPSVACGLPISGVSGALTMYPSISNSMP
eukprot:COSAG01_NODE_25682_length_737_cov_0.996865_2_plen_44_part_01